MTDGYTLRRATLADAPMLARHRRLMFEDMGSIGGAAANALEAAVAIYMARAVPTGAYRGWLIEFDGQVVAGGGFQIREMIPRPGYINQEPEGLIVNMWTNSDHRRRGLGQRLIDTMLEASREIGIRRLTLHAAEAGQPLYAKNGFTFTNEMRLDRPSE